MQYPDANRHQPCLCGRHFCQRHLLCKIRAFMAHHLDAEAARAQRPAVERSACDLSTLSGRGLPQAQIARAVTDRVQRTASRHGKVHRIDPSRARRTGARNGDDRDIFNGCGIKQRHSSAGWTLDHRAQLRSAPASGSVALVCPYSRETPDCIARDFLTPSRNIALAHSSADLPLARARSDAGKITEKCAISVSFRKTGSLIPQSNISDAPAMCHLLRQCQRFWRRRIFEWLVLFILVFEWVCRRGTVMQPMRAHVQPRCKRFNFVGLWNRATREPFMRTLD